MIPEIPEDLKKIADKILKGDILNIPNLHKSEQEKVLYYCICTLKTMVDIYFENFNAELLRITQKIEELEKELDAKEAAGKSSVFGKKKK